MPSAVLRDRNVLAISGPEALTFLQGLITADISRLDQGQACFGALLTPQGKISADFFVLRAEDGFWLDVDKRIFPELIKKLTLYRLRAKVVLTDISADFAVGAWWGSEPSASDIQFWLDPRLSALGYRTIAPHMALAGFGADDYLAHCLELGVPVGGIDFDYGSLFPHDANMDLLHGLAFDKGCFIGQEIVSRVQHRGTARKRFVPIRFDGPDLASGTDISDGERSLGVVSRSQHGRGLALMRLDHVDEALHAQRTIKANGQEINMTRSL
jgi:hypothetical protein